MQRASRDFHVKLRVKFSFISWENLHEAQLLVDNIYLALSFNFSSEIEKTESEEVKACLCNQNVKSRNSKVKKIPNAYS